MIQPIRSQKGDPMTMAGLRKRYTPETMKHIPELWTEFVPFLKDFPGRQGIETYGLVWDAFTHGNHFEYMAAVAVSGTDSLPSPLETLEIPVATYAVFEHVGSLEFLSQTIGAIYSEWLPQADVKPAPFPLLMEVYGAEFEPATLSGRIELWMAVGD